MPEHKAQDRSGKIFKQVLAVANDKLRDIAGLEIICEADAGEDEEAEAGGASQAGPSQSQATQGGVRQAANDRARFQLVNKLKDPVVPPLAETTMGTAIYHSFVEVILSLIRESDGTIDEDTLFECLSKLGLKRDSKLPQQSLEQEKIESIVQKRLVAEAYIRRIKKQDEFEYVAGSRATLARNEERAVSFNAEFMDV